MRESRSYGTRRSRAVAGSRATGRTRATGGGSHRSYTRYRSGYIAPGVTPHGSVTRDSHGRIRRSAAAKDAFKRQQPCPSTGRISGACPGYVIDHVKPLECGGADAPSNMQWQTVADGKAKDKTERYCR
ncbi:MAG TPA: HNH endonuclease signature motif containing protein [Terracidiphilus sp.]|nr:HNH endonuclease signature motif containing protein [Terracidiphilus sp.]